MTMPNFFIIGAGKAGTTALHRYLKQHPQIFMSEPKELSFFPFEDGRPDFRGPGDNADFERQGVTSLDAYRACFAGAADYPVRGESSPVYLYYPESARRIRHHVPEAKLVAVLRQPAAAAYSRYLMLRGTGVERLSFVEALAAEDGRVAGGWAHRWHYLRRGFYAKQLKPFFDIFPREQIGVYLYDDLLADPVGFVQEIFRFLNVDESFVPDMSVRHNESRVPHNRALQTYLLEPRRAKELVKRFVPPTLSRRVGDRLRRLNQSKPPLPDELRRELTEIYREDILELQRMLGRDLSRWLD
jgi:hypothetical protein